MKRILLYSAFPNRVFMIQVVKSFTSWTKGLPDIIFQILESYTSWVARNLVEKSNHMCNLSLHTSSCPCHTFHCIFVTFITWCTHNLQNISGMPVFHTFKSSYSQQCLQLMELWNVMDLLVKVWVIDLSRSYTTRYCSLYCMCLIWLSQ
jgi:hypothetical protein